MRIKFTYLLPIFYLILAVLSPFLGPIGVIMAYVGMPLSYIANNWYLKYGDPTFVAIIGGAFQYLIFGFIIDVASTLHRRRKNLD